MRIPSNLKILLAPTYNSAKQLAEKCRILASVEAEYGSHVIQGEFYTLAHHAPLYRKNRAPCFHIIEPLDPSLEGIILISHIDLDTLLGIYYLIRNKEDPVPELKIREAAEKIDVGGYHLITELDENIQPLFRAILGILGTNPPFNNVLDVTETVLKNIDLVLSILIDKEPTIIQVGLKLEEEQRKEKESCFIYGTDLYLIYRSKNLPCTDQFIHPQTGKKAQFVINYRSGPRAFFLASYHSDTDCDVILQSVWGRGCGGHARAAGTPRGKIISEEELPKLTKSLERYVKWKSLIQRFLGKYKARLLIRTAFKLISYFK